MRAVYSSSIGVMVRIRIRFSVWLVCCYAHVFVRLQVVIATDRELIGWFCRWGCMRWCGKERRLSQRLNLRLQSTVIAACGYYSVVSSAHVELAGKCSRFAAFCSDGSNILQPTEVVTLTTDAELYRSADFFSTRSDADGPFPLISGLAEFTRNIEIQQIYGWLSELRLKYNDCDCKYD